MSAEAKLAALKFDLPAPHAPAGNYVDGVRTGNLLFMSGAGPFRPDGSFLTGKVGDTLTVEQGYEAARLTALSMLVNIRAQLGSLDKVKRVVKTFGMVNAVPTFTQTPEVINGFSDVFAAVFGDAGRGARSAVGLVALPRQIAVEVDLVMEVE